MAAVFSEDDRNYFSKFTNARKAPTISDDMLVDVHNVLSNKEFSHSTRLAAAKILIQSGNASVGVNTHHPAVDWVILTAMLETADTARTIEIVKAWMVYFEKKRVCDNEDETLFLASLSRVLSKRGALIAENCTPKVVKLLHRYLLLAFINLSELECGAKSFEGAVQFVAKSAPHEELFDFCLNEIDSRLRGKYGILKIFFRDVTLPREEQECEPIVERICGQLTKLLDCQLITNAAADLVATLVVMFPSSKNLLRLIAQNMVHHMKCIRSNTLRWIGRFEVVRKSHDFLLSLQSSLYDSFLSVGEDIWPPQLWETEDVSCVDPVWDSDEAEDVLWKADRTLEAYLNVTSTLCQRYRHELDWNNPVSHL
ncbi:hypothetical protein Q1695_007623 [Nippostrongylus brasiliensis]|nr:hypothetical protein Q1695_007623 [Nippostrongylus brasiliensis]